MQSRISYTQNFLHNRKLVNHLVEKAQIAPGTTVLEIGPGKGIITQELARAVGGNGTVLAVELDPKLALQLEREFSSQPQVKIFQQDFLQFDLTKIGIYSVFANLPFAISAQILEKLLNPFAGPNRAFLILQTESILSEQRGKSQPTFKSLLLEPFYTVQILHHFQQSDFSPAPSVQTALFAFIKRTQPLIEPRWNSLWKDFLASISQDRVGEGSWRRLYLRRELEEIITRYRLQKGKGLRSQTLDSLVQVFTTTILTNKSRQQKVTGSFASLRKRQAALLEKNELEGHKPKRS